MIYYFLFLAFLLEIAVILVSFLAYLQIISVFWYASISENGRLIIAVFAPLFTLLLFYGRTTAGQVLGIVGPTLAYSAFQCPPR